jgi:hypothetical protein
VDYARHAERDSRGLWHRVHGFDVVLEPHVYDLDVVRYLLAQEHRHHDQAVSQAVRSLVRWGQLISLPLVPIQAYENLRYGEVPDHLIHHLADGTFLSYGERQVRFVTRSPDQRVLPRV